MELHRDGELMRFSMQRSAITELERAEIWRSEIEALMALDDYTSAMNLAQSMLLKEDRLHLLAVIAKSRRAQGKSVEAELLQQIRTLYDQIDPTPLGERAIDIASDLFSSCPDLAINLVERTTWTETDENALDSAYVRLSIAAMGAHKGQSEPRDTMEILRARIKDPRLQSFTAAVSLTVENQSAQEVIAEVKKIDMAEDRLHFLRHWTVENRERSDAGDVVEYALNLAVATTTYALNARVLRELATPLPFIEDEKRVRKLVGAFDSQKGTIEHIGPTEDYVRLQLLLARAEKRYDTEACRNRLVEVYFIVAGLDDLGVQASCLAWLLAALTQIDPDNELEAKEGLRSQTTTDLTSCIEELLQATADHYHEMRSVIKALAIAEPGMGFEWAKKLNTQERRDNAILDLVDAMLEAKLERIDFQLLQQLLRAFFDQEACGKALVRIIARLSAEKNCNDTTIKKALPFIAKISELRDAGQRCRACCVAHSLLSRCDTGGEYASMRLHLLAHLDESWRHIDVGWRKVDTGFRIVKSLAEYADDLAREYLTKTEAARSEIAFNARATARTFQTCLSLTVRAFAGLLPRRVDIPSDSMRLQDLIDHLPSHGERAKIWAELALRYFMAKRSDDGRRIVTEHVHPLLQGISDNDQAYRDGTIVAVAPALYIAHSSTAKDLIRNLPQPVRDEAFRSIAEFILWKKPSSDPYENRGYHGYDVDYAAIMDIIEIVREMEQDNHVYYFIECIAQTLSARQSRDQFTRQQRAAVAEHLKDIASTKFPDQRNITHEGYKIIADAQIAQLQRATPQDWENLLARAQAIPNIADSGFVRAIIGAAMPRSEAERRRKAFEQAIVTIKQIPSLYDCIARLVDLASIIMDMEPNLAKGCLRTAMESLVKWDASGYRIIQRRIVDLAYKLAPTLADSLASLVDDDTARGNARAILNRRLEILKLKTSIMDLPSGVSLPAQAHTALPDAAWMVLGSLNARRTNPMHLEYTRAPVRLAANYPLQRAYPILAWVIENAVQRLSRTDQANTTLRPLLEATYVAAEISARMTIRFSDRMQRTIKRRIAREAADGSLLISAGDREKALQFLRDWFTHEVKDYLKICDQFFGPSDLDLLMMLLSANPHCKVQILTSTQYHDKERISSPGTEYLEQWHQISDQEPPDTEVVIVGTESSGKSPIHDRWWLTRGGGLKIGTSFNSLGITQDSTITRIPNIESEMLESDVDQYLIEKKREYNGERLRYLSFTL